MGTSTSFESLVECAYGAAGDAGAWAAFIERYVEEAGCEAACLLHSPLHHPTGAVAAAAGIDPATIRAFDQHYSRINPYAPALARLGLGEVVEFAALAPGSHHTRTEFYCDYVVPLRHHIAASFGQLFAGPDIVSTLGLFSTSQKKGETERVFAFQKRFIGHLQCAFRLHARIVDLKGQVNDLMAALDYRGVAVLSVDSAARVIGMTRRAAAILERNDGLGYRGGVLEARSAAPVSVARALQTVTGLAEGRSHEVPVYLRVERGGGAQDYELVFCPVVERHRELRAHGARALVFVCDPSDSPLLSVALLSQSYGLSKAEASVVQMLASGESPPGIARRLRVSRETVKSHLSAAYAKTGTRGQSELVHAVLTGVAGLSDLAPGQPPPVR